MQPARRGARAALARTERNARSHPGRGAGGRLMPAAIALFLFDLDAPLPPGAAEWLDPAERERSLRFADPALRQRFVAGRATLRRLLAQRTGDAPAKVAIEGDAHGKPRLCGSRLAFNLSHAGRHALLAIGPAGLELGVDIEDIRAIADVDALATICLSPAERACFAECRDDAVRRASFLRLWVRKEACLKAIGEGLRIEPAEFSVGFAPPGADWPARVRQTDLRVSDLDPGIAGFAAAIAVTGTLPMPSFGPLSRLAPDPS